MKWHFGLSLASGLLWIAGCAPGLLAQAAFTTQTINLTIYPAAKLSVPGTLSMTHAGTTFAAFIADLRVDYRVRTSPGSGRGTLTLQVSEFNSLPGTGPRADNGDLTYTCAGATAGTPCTGVQTARPGTQTEVLVVQPGVCTGEPCGNSNPNSVHIYFTLENSPTYQTGSYSTQVTLNISAI